MQKYQNAIQDVHGNAIASATVTVYLYGTLTPAAIYSDNGLTVIPSSQVTTDSDGQFYFYADNGRYTLSVMATGFAQEQFSDVSLFDQADAGIASVKDYGVVGNGIVDDTAALQTAITSVGVNATLLIPAGVTCKVSSEINFNVSGLKLVGYGASITKSATFTGSGVLRITATNVVLEGFQIDGTDNADDGVITSSSVASGFVARNLTVINCAYGISANSNSNVTIENCNISLVSLGAIRAHNIAAASVQNRIRILNNRIDLSNLNPATTTQNAVLVRGDVLYYTNDVQISGNTIIHAENPTNSAALCCEMRYVDSGLFNNNVGINGSMLISAAACTNVTVDGNVCDGANFYGIEVPGVSPSAGCQNITISGNSIFGRGRLKYAIALQGTAASEGCAVSGNTMQGTTQYGIFSNEQWDDLSISGNRIDVTYVGGNQYGIYLLGTATTITNVSISANTLNGNNEGEKAIFLRSVVGATIVGNTGPSWTQNGIYIDGSSATCDEISISGNTFNGLSTTAITKIGTLGNYVTSSSNGPYRRSGTLGCNDFDLNNNVFESWGTGTPEAAVTANVGSVFHRRDGGAGTCLYVKESGTGNTGWVAK